MLEHLGAIHLRHLKIEQDERRLHLLEIAAFYLYMTGIVLDYVSTTAVDAEANSWVRTEFLVCHILSSQLAWLVE